MRIALLFLFCIATSNIWSQDSIVISKNCFRTLPDTATIIQVPSFQIDQPQEKSPKIRIRCGYAVSITESLWVIDGIPGSATDFKHLSPNDIQSIDVLKENTALACYGSATINGVILITTNAAKSTSLIIKDGENGSLLKGATVGLINKSDTLWLQSTEEGVVSSERIKRDVRYRMKISYVGYETKDTMMTFKKGKQALVELERAYTECEGVIIKSYPAIRCRKIFFGEYLTGVLRCSAIGVSVQSETKGVLVETGFKPDFTIYPNPVSRLSFVTIQTTNPSNQIVELINFSGQIIKKEILSSNLYKLLVPNIAAGTYLIRITDGSQKQTLSKLVVQ